MGLFKRLRAASSSRKPPESTQSQANTSASTVDGSVASARTIKRSPSSNLLSVPDKPAPPPRVSTSSTVASTSSLPGSARSSMLPWKKDKRRDTDELQSIPYETTSASPLSGSGAHPSPSPARSSYPRPLPATPLIQHIPTIANASATQSSRPSPSSRPPPRSPAYHTSPPPSPSSPTAERTYHARNPSHESSRTVVSLNSTLTGRSRRTSDSQEWRRDGGVLGKFVFESGDWGAISAATPFQSPPSSSAPSKHTTPGASPSKLTLHPPTLVMSATPKSKPAPKDSGRPTIRKLGASHTSPSLPSVSTFSNNPLGAHSPEDSTHAGDWPPVKQQERADVTELQGKDKARDVTVEAKKAPTPPKEMVTDLPKDEVEEIFSSTSEPDLDERRRFWKPGMRTRRTSRSRPVEDRPVSMSHVEPRPPLRRPPSSLFHIPFGRTQSRVSLAFDDQPSHADDGSFQLKSFRHISGASDAEGGFSQYLSLAKNDDRGKSGQDRQTSDSTIIPLRSSTGAVSPLPPPSPTAIPRPRPPSAAGSDSSQRVSVAAFRKGVRRPSSSVLLDDDDDDVPLSLSRAQIFESAGLRRDSGSALSLTDHPSPPARPKRALPPTPLDNARSDSPSPIGLGPPPAMRATNPSSPALGFAVKGPRRILDDAKDAKMQNTFGERLPSPSPVLAPIVTSSPKVIRPPRASSLTVAAEDGLGIWTPPILSTSPDGQASTVMSPTVMSPTATSTRSPSQSPPPPARLRIPEPQANMEELMIKLPPRPDELHDEATPRDSPHRGATLSPSFSMPFDEPLRRISGLWSGGTPDLSSDKEEGFNPTLVESTLRDSQRRSDSNHENRQSLYDRLAVAASAATSSVVSALPTTTSSEERLYIPPVRTPSPPPIQAQSPTSERTASPIPVPPAMELPPAPVPPMPHSSFGRVPRRAAEKPAGPRAGKSGWASSSDDEDDDERRPRPRPATSASTATTRTMVAARPQPAAPRPQSSAILRGKVDKIDKVEIISDSDEDEPLKVLKTSRSRSDLTTSRSRTDLQLRPAISRSSHSGSSLQKPDEPARPTSILKPTLTGNGNGHANGHANGPVTGRRSRTTSMHNGTAAAVTPSASKWSLSSSPNDSPESDPMSPPVRPISRPNSRHAARPISRVSIARDSSADPSRPMPRTASTDQMPKLGRPKSAADLIPRKHSSDRLRAGPQSTTKMHAPSPRHGPIAMVAVNDARPTASPASSQSGLTGDSSGQQPMTPRSVGDPSRRSWADGRLRPDAETASVRARPASQFDWASGPPPSGAQFPYPGMDPYGQQTVYKQQIQAQWMAAAQRHFEDMWERASSVSNAQTAPHGSSANMFQPTYGYSYSQPPPMPPMPQMPYGGYGQYPPYGGYGGPQVAFPSGMPGGMPMGMPGMAGAMPGMPGGMPGMPMGGGGYAYGPGVQSVYGGEFGPPVAPGMRETAAPGSPGGSPSRQRARRTSGVTEGGRPASIAHNLPSSSASVIGVPASHYSQQRATPPRRPGARRSSGLALSEVGGPPSSWRLSAGDELDTPRAKRVTNAS